MKAPAEEVVVEVVNVVEVVEVVNVVAVGSGKLFGDFVLLSSELRAWLTEAGWTREGRTEGGRVEREGGREGEM